MVMSVSNTLDGGVVSQVHEHDRAVDSAGLPKALHEEVGFLEGDAHGGEDHHEGVVGAAHLGLAGYLSGQLGVGQAGGREYGQLLAADQGVQAVDSRNAGLDELLGIVAGGGVHGQAVHVHAHVGQDLRPVVNGAAQAVEDPAQHVLADPQLHAVAQETYF